MKQQFFCFILFNLEILIEIWNIFCKGGLGKIGTKILTKILCTHLDVSSIRTKKTTQKQIQQELNKLLAQGQGLWTAADCAMVTPIPHPIPFLALKTIKPHYLSKKHASYHIG